jgi:ABC-type multidrug transport system ATPase subunit
MSTPREGEPQAVLVADCVGKRFGDRKVLTSASLRAVAGRWTALMGRNGIGKSTLLRIAAGATEADSGSIRLDGEMVERPHTASLAARGLFFLADRDLFSPRYPVRTQLELFRTRFDGGPVDAAACEVGIQARMDQRPHQLSSGERRRAELAAAIVRRPRCLLADEPYRNVSPIDAEAITHALRSLAAGGCAVVITGHETSTFLPAVDHVTWCEAGTTVELGSPAEAMRHERFALGYLGSATP